MTAFNRVQGDVNDTLSVTLGGVQDLTGVTSIEAHVWRTNIGSEVLTASVVSAVDRTILVQLSPWLETCEAGGWFLEYQATFGDGSQLTWPEGKTDSITVRSDGVLPDVPAISAGGAALALLDARFIAQSTLTTNGNLVSRAAGVPSEVTRAALAADTAFTSKYQPVTVITGDGTTDNGAAIRSATAAGGVVVLRGTIRYVASAIMLPAANTRIVGEPGTVINVEGTDLVTYHPFMWVQNDNVTIEGCTINRLTDFPCVFFPVGNCKSFKIRDCVINGNRDTLTTNYCHVINTGVVDTGSTDGVEMLRTTVTKCSYGLLQTNESLATTKRIRVRDCTFTANTGDDLSFNSPNGLMSDVKVVNCEFYDNAQTVAGSGIGVNLAFVSKVEVHGCSFTNYNNEAVHIEDYSTNVDVTDNKFVSCGLLQGSVIQVISGAGPVLIRGNQIDSTANTVHIYNINVLAGGVGGVTPGGRAVIAPRRITIEDNQIAVGASTSGIYLETTVQCTVSKNTLTGSGTVSGTGVYSGNLRQAILLFDGDSTKCSDNQIRGFFYGIRGPNTTVGACGLGGNVSGNVISRCFWGILTLNLMAGVTIANNNLYNCTHPIGVGQGTGANKPTLIAGNHASACFSPMEINIVYLRSAASITTGTTKTFTQWQTAGIALPIPSGTVLTFTGGGTFTTTANAIAGATTLAGTVAVATIAVDATATYTLPQWSTTGADNYYTKSVNPDGFVGAGAYP